MFFIEPEIECSECGEELTKEEKNDLPINTETPLCFKCIEMIEDE